MLDIAGESTDRLQREVERFLYNEAELLDAWRLTDWLGLITEDIDYRMPVRTTRHDKQAGDIFSGRSFHMIENYGSLSARVARLGGVNAWSESPHSRVRRHVSTVRVSESGGEVGAKSNLLFFWARDALEVLVSAERQDVLRRVDGRLRLARRTVLLDHTTLPVPNLSFVL